MSKCITLTFSNVVENSVGMEMIGDINNYKPFSVDDLRRLYDNYEGEKELIDLTLDKKPEGVKFEEASVLVLRGFYKNDKLFDTLCGLQWDTTAIFRGVVKNKRARYNLCFSNFDQEPSIHAGKGRVINMDNIEELKTLQQKIGKLTGYEALNAEGNYYYDTNVCGIGYHGDLERNIVIGMRVGANMSLCFHWYYQCKPIGNKHTINLGDGDLYIMSEKAVGQDWKKRSQLTLRHSAGCDKYTKVKKSKK